MLISAAILGLSAAPLWTAKSSYMTELGILYAKLTGETKEAVIIDPVIDQVQRDIKVVEVIIPV